MAGMLMAVEPGGAASVRPLPPRVRHTRAGGWKQTKRDAFLETLAQTFDVAAAAAAAEIDAGRAYALRRSDAVFAEEWREAVGIGHERLRLAVLRRLLERIEAGDGASDSGSEGKGGGATLAELQAALQMLNQLGTAGKAQAGGEPRAPKPPPSAAATDALINRKLDALARRLGRPV